MVQAIELDAIRLDDGLQPRVKIDWDAVKEYGEAMTEGAKLPAVIVYFDGIDYWLADGFHRYHAHRQIGMLKIDAHVHEGSRRDAVLYSVGANANQFALRRTNADKRRAVERLLADEEWATWSNNEIAKRCAVSHTFVDNVRSSLATNASEKFERTYTTKHGTQATMRTASIGRKGKPESVALGEDANPADTSPPMDVSTAQGAHAPYTHTPIATPGVDPTGRAAKPESDNRKEIERLKGEVASLKERVRKRDETIRKLKTELDAAKREIGALERGDELRQREDSIYLTNEVALEPSRAAGA